QKGNSSGWGGSTGKPKIKKKKTNYGAGAGSWRATPSGGQEGAHPIGRDPDAAIAESRLLKSTSPAVNLNGHIPSFYCIHPIIYFFKLHTMHSALVYLFEHST
ncbi:hypothetical protein ACOIBK_27895, partial [Klebsiella pneumoniae]|uniref:hypothetical protein n=1 Tax=Klebsiella pneumoniae TaxID=573 RepID=UPI003B5A5240